MTGELIFFLRIILIAFLYLFLGLVFLTIWKDLRTNSLLLSTRVVPSITLIEGEPGEEQNSVFQTAEVIIGRDPAAHFSIPHDNVSRQHARLSYHHNQWWVEDLNSTNGTYLNDERIYTPTVVVTGDEVRVGPVTLKILLDKSDRV
jgi:pSer/pThr/pTyr-binding forkhead associated (FHA) protein